MSAGPVWKAEVRIELGSMHLNAEMNGDTNTVALVGPNGAGKTSLLRSIAGAVTPKEGRVTIAGETVYDAATGTDLPPESRNIGYVPQGLGLFPHLTAIGNVAFAKTGYDGAETMARADRLISELGCREVRDRRVDRLSGGEAQRVALARALMTEPQLLLLDEPLAALDATARRSLRSFLASHIRARSLPTILVSHDVRDVRALADRVYVLEGGGILQVGSPDEVADAPASDFVAEFFSL